MRCISFERNRMIRMYLHMDADEDETETASETGHGNTRLPYGLCQKYGIDLPEKTTPKQAWEALKGKGISPTEAYSYLQKHGSMEGFEPKKGTLKKKGDFDKTMQKAIDAGRESVDEIMGCIKSAIKYQTYTQDFAHIFNLYSKGRDELKKARENTGGMADSVFNSIQSCIEGLQSAFSAKRANERIIDLKAQGKRKKAADYTKALNRILTEIKSSIDGITDEGDADVKKYITEIYNDMMDTLSGGKDKKLLEQLKPMREARAERQKKLAEHRGEKRKTGIKTYKHFDTEDEVTGHLSKELGIDVAKWGKVSGMNIDKANQMSDAILTIRENYGIVPSKIEVDTGSKSWNDDLANARAYWRYGTRDDGELGIRDLYSTDIGLNEPKHKSYKRWTVYDTAAGVMVHELGHGLMNKSFVDGCWASESLIEEWGYERDKVKGEYAELLASKQIDMDDIEDLTTQRMYETYTAYKKDIEDHRQYQQALKVGAAYAKAKQTGDIKKVSDYGSTSASEFFAEVFCMYVKGEKMPDYFTDMIEDFID
ncbi:MAG: hypothetical protein LUD47_07645 [Clostridia bacterium]|nr:hypothetical protein [Clostridia bacterium]